MKQTALAKAIDNLNQADAANQAAVERLAMIRQTRETHQQQTEAAQRIDTTKLEGLQSEYEAILADIATGDRDPSEAEPIRKALEQEQAKVEKLRKAAREATAAAGPTMRGLDRKEDEAQAEIERTKERFMEARRNYFEALNGGLVARYLALSVELSEIAATVAGIPRLEARAGVEVRRAFTGGMVALPAVHEHYAKDCTIERPSWWDKSKDARTLFNSNNTQAINEAGRVQADRIGDELPALVRRIEE